MNLTPTPIRSSYQSYITSEESYCSPWDLKMQEEKFKSLNNQHQIISSDKTNRSIPLSFNNHTNKSFHRTHSVPKSSTKKSFIHRELSPPELPPFPPGGLKLPCQCRSGSLTDSQPISFEICSCMNKDQSTLFHNKHIHSSIQNNSLPKTPTAYEKPWETLQTSLINNFHRRSLQKLPSTSQHCSPRRHLDDMKTIPIDRYFWYHYTMSRRQAEHVLESRLPGSFLIRQSESGNQNDYSLSIKTIKGCMHMRICYSQGFYILGECSRPFLSISCMIEYFSEVPVPIRGATHIKLGTPVLRWEILSNEELL